MAESSKDLGVISVLLERFEKQRLPRALSIKEKVDQGETLDDFDIEFLEEVFAAANEIKPLVERNPEYQKLVAQAVHLYGEIMEKALLNEKGSKPAGDIQ